MKKLIISYSFTGNNGLLARGLAEETNADYLQLQETRKRKVITIVLDVILKRKPSIRSLEKEISDYACVIFVAPIWFGKIATPFRSLFAQVSESVKSYAFVSVSSGSGGIVPHVEPELVKYLGKKPISITNHLISDLVPYNQRSDRRLLDTYKLNNENTAYLVEQTARKIQEAVK